VVVSLNLGFYNPFLQAAAAADCSAAAAAAMINVDRDGDVSFLLT